MTARLGRLPVTAWLLIAAALTSAALLLWLQSHLTFFLDDWDLLLHRRGFNAEAILRPHNEHIIVAPTLIYKAIQATLGMDSPGPYQFVAVALFIASVVLLYVWLQRRVGGWLALLGAVVILFLGSAWEDLLSPFQMGYFGSMAFGLGALLALERRTRGGDVFACVALIVSISFSSLGVPLVGGAAVAIGLAPEWRRRAFVVAIPTALFALWWLGWGHTAHSYVSFETIAGAPVYLLNGLAASIGSLLGLAPSSGGDGLVGPLPWGRPLLLLALALLGWRLHTLRRIPAWFWVVAAITVAFWILAGLNSGPFRPPTQSRYMYIGGVFVLLIAAELARGARPATGVLVGLYVVALASVASNLISLRDGYRTFRPPEESGRAGITALELARDTVHPGFRLTSANSNSSYFGVVVDAQSYLSAVDAFGSPAYTEPELAAADEPVQVAGDKALAAALRLRLEPAPAGTGCAEIAPAAEADILSDYSLGPGTYLVDGGESGSLVRIERFSQSLPVRLNRLAAGDAATLTIPEDRAATPWTLQLDGDGSVSSC